MALDVQLLTSQASKKQSHVMSRLPGYTSGLQSLGTSRRSGGPVGPNPLPKKIGALGRARAKPLGSPRGLSVGVSPSLRVGRPSNLSEGSLSPKAYDRNLNNVKPIREIRRGETHAHSADAKHNNGVTTAQADDSKRNLPPALSVDFIKHALSSNKQIYSAQEIKQKAETSWKNNKQAVKRAKTKTTTTKENTDNIQEKTTEAPSSKLIESIKTEGFGPRVKSKELNAQLKMLHRRLGGENAIQEEPVENTSTSSTHHTHTR